MSYLLFVDSENKNSFLAKVIDFKKEQENDLKLIKSFNQSCDKGYILKAENSSDLLLHFLNQSVLKEDVNTLIDLQKIAAALQASNDCTKTLTNFIPSNFNKASNFIDSITIPYTNCTCKDFYRYCCDHVNVQFKQNPSLNSDVDSYIISTSIGNKAFNNIEKISNLETNLSYGDVLNAFTFKNLHYDDIFKSTENCINLALEDPELKNQPEYYKMPLRIDKELSAYQDYYSDILRMRGEDEAQQFSDFIDTFNDYVKDSSLTLCKQDAYANNVDAFNSEVLFPPFEFSLDQGVDATDISDNVFEPIINNILDYQIVSDLCQDNSFNFSSELEDTDTFNYLRGKPTSYERENNIIDIYSFDYKISFDENVQRYKEHIQNATPNHAYSFELKRKFEISKNFDNFFDTFKNAYLENVSKDFQKDYSLFFSNDNKATEFKNNLKECLIKKDKYDFLHNLHEDDDIYVDDKAFEIAYDRTEKHLNFNLLSVEQKNNHQNNHRFQMKGRLGRR